MDRTPIDLDACAAEPIRTPGGIQPHGALLVVDPATGKVLQASANLTAVTGLEARPGEALQDLAGLVSELNAGAEGASVMRVAAIGERLLQVAAHRTPQGLLIEFEPPPASEEETLEALYPRIRGFLEAVRGAESIGDIARLAVREIRALTGFNRTLLYSFDPKGDGTVLAEDTDGVLPSYLNLRFPAADIPAQARALYKRSRLRLIPDATYTPAPLDPPLSPVDGRPLDLSDAALRSVSPVHLEYMRNMGTASSMSISIIVDGELWGLVSGHSQAPRMVNAQVRSACDHLGQLLSLQIEALEKAQRSAESLRLRNLQSELLVELGATPDYAAGLVARPDTWLSVAGGAGAALVSGEQIVTVGLAPSEAEVRAIADRLFSSGQAEAVTESMAAAWPEAAAFADVASGLLAVSISQIHPNYLMWFRPEAVRTVTWAGEPHKPREIGERLHPRKSFELWKEQVRQQAIPWKWEEVDSARSFQAAIQAFVLRRAEERAELTTRLGEINRELESFSYSISHDLRAPFRHVVGFAELLGDQMGQTMDDTSRHYLASIKESALAAGRLVDDLLNFSQLGRNSLRFSRIDMGRIANEARRSLVAAAPSRRISWRIGDLPPAWGDAAMVRQVFANLLENALKYAAKGRDLTIEITGESRGDATVYTVADNGVGFDMAYAHKLFQVFERLHRSEDFEGTGIGLALVRRIIERHGGAVSAEAEVDGGARFTFSLPKQHKAIETGASAFV